MVFGEKEASPLVADLVPDALPGNLMVTTTFLAAGTDGFGNGAKGLATFGGGLVLAGT